MNPLPDPNTLSIVLWPDPRLKRISVPVTVFDESLRLLTARMFELMREHEGVGLAAPQVGLNIRLFVMNHTGKPEDDRVVVNPVLMPVDGRSDGEEGCLSIPDIRIGVVRTDTVTLEAQDVEGKPFSITRSGFETRVWQHENDHLDGILLTDRMSFSERMRFKKALARLKDQFKPTPAGR